MTPEEFQARRQDLELTQIQLAEELGITERAVRYYEKGERRIPRTDRQADYDPREKGEPAMTTRKIRYFVTKRDGDQPLRYYWQPRAELREHGWQAQRLPNDEGAAIARAEALNTEPRLLVQGRGCRPARHRQCLQRQCDHCRVSGLTPLREAHAVNQTRL